jgi:hypothetical protein
MAESAGAACQNAHKNPTNMSPPHIRRMIQKIRRLAASLGIGLRPPVDDTAAGVRLIAWNSAEPNIPTAQVRATDRRQKASDDINYR